MMEFALAASGSAGNCFLLDDNGVRIMIDCGTTKRYLKEVFTKLRFTNEELQAVLITHDHSDHVSQIRHFTSHPVYSPVELADQDIIPVKPQKAFTVGGLQITPLALSHDAMNTTGYIIENSHEKLVYITDTGYINQRYLKLISDADYYVMESNHDTSMLMKTRRPQYVKARIISDQGHLSNEDCAWTLNKIITERTKMVILAHISREGNTREKALEVNRDYILRNHNGRLYRDLVLCAAGQYEVVRKGLIDEKVDPGSVSCNLGLEYMADFQTA